MAFPGTVIWDTRYLDSEDISGTLAEQFKGAFAFLKRNLHHVQRGQGFNSPGELEIPETALEELLVNALVHRDYFTSASIRILIFTDRVEIIARVAERVRQGGHDIPEAVIRRRFLAGRKNFEQHYRDAVNDWSLYDNAGGLPVLLEWGERA